MLIVEKEIKGVLELQPKIYEDDRGHFFEVFRLNTLAKFYPNYKVVQQNESSSKYGVIRGLHFQNPPYEQAKLIRVIHGEILDVAVDIRRGSSTYGEHVAVKLSDKNKKQLFIPEGFAHGFSVLSETATIVYKINNYYKAKSEGSIHPFSDELNIDWCIKKGQSLLSTKDRESEQFSDFITNFK